MRNIKFIHNVIVNIDGLIFSTESSDIAVNISEDKDSNVDCSITLYNLNKDSLARVVRSNLPVEVSIEYLSTKTTTSYFLGYTVFGYKNKDKDDEMAIIVCDGGFNIAHTNTSGDNYTTGLPMINYVRDIIKDSELTVNDYPESLNKPHPAGRSVFTKGSLDKQLKDFLGNRYTVKYNSKKLIIIENKIGSYGNGFQIDADSLFDYPRLNINRRSLQKGKTLSYAKTFHVKVIPEIGLKYGQKLMIKGSDVIDEKFYIISSIYYSFDKTEVSCTMQLKEDTGEEDFEE